MLKIRCVTEGWSRGHDILSRAEKVVAFAVKDTGIGIPKEKHQIIFEAFQQADGTTSRKYAGTGLGLSISREIARALGGEVGLKSDPGKGSTFTLYLPLTPPPNRQKAGSPSEGPAGSGSGEPTPSAAARSGERALAPSPAPASAKAAQAVSEWQEKLDDDRETIQAGDRVLLVVEDDVAFAQILLDMARAHGFKGLVAERAETTLRLVRGSRVDAITLDLGLPDRVGWLVLDQLKHDPKTRHIPVHIFSAQEEDEQRVMKQGAMGFLRKPASKEAVEEALGRLKSFVDRPVKKLLVVEGNEVQRKSIIELIGNHDVQTTAAATGEEALAALSQEPFDCMSLNLGLPDMTGFALIERIKSESGLRGLPIIVYTGKELSKKEEIELRYVAEALVVKGVRSRERLLYETALFLHQVEANLPERKRRVLEQLRKTDATLAEQKVLIVDDDVRNTFALTSILERYGIKAVYAENGEDAIALLKNTPDIELVLMDVMMPEMDGYETMRAIRNIVMFKKLPIIAVTAKAMKWDRQKCIEAGASDYIAKPVDIDQLLSLLRVWLYHVPMSNWHGR